MFRTLLRRTGARRRQEYTHTQDQESQAEVAELTRAHRAPWVFQELIEHANRACADTRVLVDNVVKVSLQEAYPKAFLMYSGRLYRLRGVDTEDRLLEILHEILQFLKLADMVKSTLDSLRGPAPRTRPLRKRVKGALRSVFEADLKMPLKMSRSLAQLKTQSVSQIEYVFDKQHDRIDEAATPEELADILHDIRALDALLKRAKTADRGGVTRDIVIGGGPVEQALMCSPTRFLTTYYNVMAEFPILLNRNLQAAFRVRASVRIMAQVAMAALDLTCTLTVGTLFGDGGRFACAGINVVFALIFIMSDASHRRNARKINEGTAYHMDLKEYGASFGKTLFFLATIFAFLAFHPEHELRGFDNQPVSLEHLVPRLLTGNHEPTDICDIVAIKLRICRMQRHELNPALLRTGYALLRTFAERAGLREPTDVPQQCEICMRILDVLIEMEEKKTPPPPPSAPSKAWTLLRTHGKSKLDSLARRLQTRRRDEEAKASEREAKALTRPAAFRARDFELDPVRSRLAETLVRTAADRVLASKPPPPPPLPKSSNSRSISTTTTTKRKLSVEK